MIINHNMNALNAHRNMALNNVNSGKSMEKLSSGLRINKAGDDAAGLAISEKMRGQIRGLDQASRNAQDGISLIQTAEGALNETHSILQRMKELATQSANDTNTVKDREQIQNELNQLTSEVNRIGNTTEFNTIKLVDGSAGSATPSNITTPSGGTTTGGTSTGGATGTSTGGTGTSTGTGGATGGTSPTAPLTQPQKDRVATLQGLQSWWIGGSTEIIKNSFGLDASGANIKVNFIDDPSSGALASVGYKIYTNGATGVPLTGKGEDLTLNVNMNYFKNLDLSTNQNGSSPSSSLYLDRTMVHEMTHAVMSQTMNFASLNTWFKEGSAEFAHGADERLKNDLFQLSGQSVVSNQFQLSDAGVATLTSKLADKTSWAANGAADTSQYYSASYVAMRYMDEQLDNAGVAGGVKAIMGYLSANQTKTLDDALTNVANTPWKTEADFINAFKNDVKTLADLQSKCDITLNSNTVVKDSHLYFANEVDTGSMLGSDSNSSTGTSLNAEDVIKETATLTTTTPTGTQNVGGFNVTWTDPLATPTTGSSGSPVIYVAANVNSTSASAPSTATVGSTSGTVTGTALTEKIIITDKVIEATTTSATLNGGVEIHEGKSATATGDKAFAGITITNDDNELSLTLTDKTGTVTQDTIALTAKAYANDATGKADFLKDLNTALNGKFGAGNIVASLNSEDKVVFTTKDTGAKTSVSITGGDMLTHLTSDGTSSKISTNSGVDANNTLNLKLGSTDQTITLVKGTYKNADELSTAIQNEIGKAGSALKDKVFVKADGNSLILTGTDKNDVTVSGGAAQNILGFSNAKTTKAQDVNNELKITVDGESIAVKVASGEFDANELAGMLQNKINEGTKTAKDINVSVKDGRLTFESGSKGTSSKIEIQDNALAKSLGLSTGSVTKNGENGSTNSIKLQIGANQGQSISLSISDMRASALGITGEKGTGASVSGAKFTSNNAVTNGTDSSLTEASLDVLSHDSATAAIKVLDNAINTVSTERSKLGAYQNRLEHTIANLGTSSENLTSAESRIRDVDMAKEMMTFSKNNILTQAAQAMLAQAKSQPEGVLQLLR